MKDEKNYKIAKKIVKSTLERMKDGEKKFKQGHLMADMLGREFDEELQDVLAYQLLSLVRVYQAKQKVKVKIEKVYWEELLHNQTTEFLLKIRNKIEKELDKRRKSKLYCEVCGMIFLSFETKVCPYCKTKDSVRVDSLKYSL